MSALHSSVHCARLEYCAEDQHLNAFLHNFDCILDALQEYTDSAPTESAAKAQGFAKVTGHSNFLVSLKCAVAVPDHIEMKTSTVLSSPAD